MAANGSANEALDNIRSLARLVAEVTQGSRELCGCDSAIAQEAAGLQNVLGRLEKEASKALTTPDKGITEGKITQRCDLCRKDLESSRRVILAYQELRASEESIAGTFLGLVPRSFDPTQQKVLDHFQLQFTNHIIRFSHLFRYTAMQIMEHWRLILDDAREDVSTKITSAASILMSGGCFSRLADAKPPTDELVWSQLSTELLKQEIPKAFLDQYTHAISEYAKAFREIQAYDKNSDVIVEKPYKVPDTKPSSRVGNDRRHSEPMSNKRARDDTTDDKPLHTKHPRSCSSSAQNHRTEFVPSDGSQTSHGLSGPLPHREQIQNIQYTLFTDYEPRVKSLLSEGVSEITKLQRHALVKEIEDRVLNKLDKIELGEDGPLRGLKKMVTDKVLEVLKVLECKIPMGEKARCQTCHP